jgi:hypothetical protein
MCDVTQISAICVLDGVSSTDKGTYSQLHYYYFQVFGLLPAPRNPQMTLNADAQPKDTLFDDAKEILEQ